MCTNTLKRTKARRLGYGTFPIEGWLNVEKRTLTTPKREQEREREKQGEGRKGKRETWRHRDREKQIAEETMKDSE